jgi:hypothetical protein
MWSRVSDDHSFLARWVTLLRRDISRTDDIHGFHPADEEEEEEEEEEA